MMWVNQLCVDIWRLRHTLTASAGSILSEDMESTQKEFQVDSVNFRNHLWADNAQAKDLRVAARPRGSVLEAPLA